MGFEEEVKKLGERFKKGEISEEEFINEAVRLMIKYNVRPRAVQPFSAVEAVRENRDD